MLICYHIDGEQDNDQRFYEAGYTCALRLQPALITRKLTYNAEGYCGLIDSIAAQRDLWPLGRMLGNTYTFSCESIRLFQYHEF